MSSHNSSKALVHFHSNFPDSSSWNLLCLYNRSILSMLSEVSITNHQVLVVTFSFIQAVSDSHYWWTSSDIRVYGFLMKWFRTLSHKYSKSMISVVSTSINLSIIVLTLYNVSLLSRFENNRTITTTFKYTYFLLELLFLIFHILPFALAPPFVSVLWRWYYIDSWTVRIVYRWTV